MLDVGWTELLVIAIVMVVVVGPKDLPKMLRAFGKATTRMRSTANDFRRQFDEALKEAELDDVKTLIDETRKLDPRGKLTKVFDPIRSAGEDLRASLKPSTPISTTPVSTTPAADKPVDDVPVEPAPAPVAKLVAATAVKAKPAKKPAAKATATKPKPAAKATVIKPAAVPAKVESIKTAPAKKTTKKTTGKTGSKA